MTESALAPAPADFDHNGVHYAANYEDIAREGLAMRPVAWSDSHGGFWLVSRYEDVSRIAKDWKQFSSENHVASGESARRGVMIPPLNPPLLLNECDPPVHTRRRMIEAPYFAPKHLRRWEEAARLYVDRALDEVIESGRIEFVEDLCLKVPAMTTLHVGGVDTSEWQLFARPEEHPGGMQGGYAEIMDKLKALIQARKDNPREDMASAMAHAKIDGEPMDLDVAAGMLHTVVTGGFDTATSVLCNSFDWLERHPDRRAYLRDHPELMENAVEEFLRSFPPLHNLARNVTEDVDVGGRTLRAGDRVLMSLYAANHDPEKFEDPFVLRFDRPNARDHLAYSAGAHRCLGAPLARLELRMVIATVLQRLGDYVIDRSVARRYDTIPFTNGWHTLPATFAPGEKVAQS